jgi:hypothetical protein
VVTKKRVQMVARKGLRKVVRRFHIVARGR